jgi:hypothetical protein
MVKHVHKVFWFLLLTEGILLLMANDADVRLLRIAEFGELGNEKILKTYLCVLKFGVATIYISTLIISLTCARLLGVGSLLNRIKILGLTVTWPFLVHVLYGFLIGYPAS